MYFRVMQELFAKIEKFPRKVKIFGFFVDFEGGGGEIRLRRRFLRVFAGVAGGVFGGRISRIFLKGVAGRFAIVLY